MASVSGWVTGTSDHDEGSTQPWTNIANATGAPDGSFASNGSSLFPGNPTDALVGSATTTAVPSGSTITAVHGTFVARSADGSAAYDNISISVTDGTNTWTYAITNDGSNLATSFQQDTFDGAAGSGGLPATMVTASGTLNLDVRFSCQANSFSGCSADCDAIGWAIDYTAPSDGPPDESALAPARSCILNIL